MWIFLDIFIPVFELLARLSKDKLVAHRFEVYVRGMELGNGFWELTCVKEQKLRFMQDNLVRNRRLLPKIELDKHLLAALEYGLPNCSGIAIGLDRLLMLKLNKDYI